MPLRVAVGRDTGVTPADLILRGGWVHTADPRQPRAEAVAVRDGVLVSVGSAIDVSTEIGPDTRIIDLPSDHLVLPGFIDAHTHYTDGPLQATGVDLSEAETLDEIVEILTGAEPESGVIVGAGWRSHIFPQGPERSLLDEIFGDTPAVLREINLHSLWVNTAALNAAGITSDTPDPEPGFSMFVRDEAGEPTGWVLEATACDLVAGRVAPSGVEQERDALLAMQGRYAAAGLTGVFDAGIFTIDERDGWELLIDLDRRGLLGQRVVGSKIAAFDPPDAVSLLAAAREQFVSPGVRIDTLKIFVDGVPEAHTAAYLAPYDDRPETSGPLAAPEDQIQRWAVDADAAGLSCHFHAIGDRAVRVALDAVEVARSRRDSGVIHTICHGDLIDPTDLQRFVDLGVVWNTSGQWIAPTPVDRVMQRRLGERARRHYTLRSALDLGVVVTLGADFPASSYVSTFKPLMLIESAVTRRLAGDVESEPLPPAAEAISVREAVAAMTTSAAYQLGIDDHTGALVAGNDADLVVLKRNILEIPSHEIAATPVALTMRFGRITHQAM